MKVKEMQKAVGTVYNGQNYPANGGIGIQNFGGKSELAQNKTIFRKQAADFQPNTLHNRKILSGRN